VTWPLSLTFLDEPRKNRGVEAVGLCGHSVGSLNQYLPFFKGVRTNHANLQLPIASGLMLNRFGRPSSWAAGPRAPEKPTGPDAQRWELFPGGRLAADFKRHGTLCFFFFLFFFVFGPEQIGRGLSARQTAQSGSAS